MHRTANHRIANLSAKLALRIEPQIREDAGDQILKGEVAAQDFGAGEIVRAQVALQRLNEPALLLRIEIMFDRGGAGPRTDTQMPTLANALHVEHRAEGLRLAAAPREAHQIDLAPGRGQCDGAVGGAEVDADGKGIWLLPHLTIISQSSETFYAVSPQRFRPRA